MAKNSRALLKVAGLSVSYGFVSALRNASVELFEGEFVALIGANGAGKSTLLETVLGMHHSDSGGIFFQDEEIPGNSGEVINKRKSGTGKTIEERGFADIWSAN